MGGDGTGVGICLMELKILEGTVASATGKRVTIIVLAGITGANLVLRTTSQSQKSRIVIPPTQAKTITYYKFRTRDVAASSIRPHHVMRERGE